MMKHRWRLWLWLVAGWAGLSLFSASSTYLSYAYSPNRMGLGLALQYSAVNWALWGVLAIPIVLVAGRVSLEEGQRLRGILVLAAFGVFIAWSRVWLYGHLAHVLYGAEITPMALRIPRQWPANFLTYGVLLLAYYAFRYYRLYRERELRASQLEAGLAHARLEALRMQLHPHFLFNTLNSISTLMHRDVEAADDMLSALSDLLRVALDRSAVQETPLNDELDFLRRYLDIEQIRFGGRLRVEMDIPPECLDALVPNLLLQPLVENAVRHGVASRLEGGIVAVRARRESDRLELAVTDDGPGVAANAPIVEGVGLSNTADRLQQLHGEQQSVRIDSSPGGGFTVTVSFPFKTE